jgi:hypothetical protein
MNKPFEVCLLSVLPLSPCLIRQAKETTEKVDGKRGLNSLTSECPYNVGAQTNLNERYYW